MIKKLLKIATTSAAVIVATILLTLNAKATTSTLALSQYYTALANQGGGFGVTKEQAAQFATYYNALYNMGVTETDDPVPGANSSTASAPSQAAPAAANYGTLVNVVNVNASNDFYTEACTVIYNLPEHVKQLVNQYGVTYYTYNSANDFGYNSQSVGGVTNVRRTVSGGNRSVAINVCISEHVAGNLKTNVCIYHETGHVVDHIIWQRTGANASDTVSFYQCLDGEISPLMTINGYNRGSGYSNREYFADAYSTYYLNNAAMQNTCPKLYYFMATLGY